MTRQTFYRNLHKAAQEISFDNDGGAIRSDSIQNYFCPLTAVLYYKTGEVLGNSFYFEAASKLGLSREDAELIANCADDFTNSTDKRYGFVRKALLRAVGLA